MVDHSLSALSMRWIPVLEASVRGLSIQGAGTRSVNARMSSWWSTPTKSGTRMPSSWARMRIRIASLSRKTPRARVAHARDAQVLAEPRGHVDLDVVEGDDPVEAERASGSSTVFMVWAIGVNTSSSRSLRQRFLRRYVSLVSR